MKEFDYGWVKIIILGMIIFVVCLRMCFFFGYFFLEDKEK